MLKKVEILQNVILVNNRTPKPECCKAKKTTLNTFKSFRFISRYDFVFLPVQLCATFPIFSFLKKVYFHVPSPICFLVSTMLVNGLEILKISLLLKE